MTNLTRPPTQKVAQIEVQQGKRRFPNSFQRTKMVRTNRWICAIDSTASTFRGFESQLLILQGLH